MDLGLPAMSSRHSIQQFVHILLWDYCFRAVTSCFGRKLGAQLVHITFLVARMRRELLYRGIRVNVGLVAISQGKLLSVEVHLAAIHGHKTIHLGCEGRRTLRRYDRREIFLRWALVSVGRLR